MAKVKTCAHMISKDAKCPNWAIPGTPFCYKHRDSTTPPPKTSDPSRDIASNLEALKSSRFIGNKAQSQNRQFLIAWRDGNPLSKICGEYRVYNKGKLIHKGACERPNDCKIGNNGNYIINDWLFSTGLNGIFYAYNHNGDLILKRRYAANLKNNVISDDGAYSACELCNSPSKDGGSVKLFDLSTGNSCGSFYPKDDAGILTSISSSELSISFSYREYGLLKYDFKGNILDKEQWINTIIDKGTGDEIVYIVEDDISNKSKLNNDLVNDFITILNMAITKGISNPDNKAKAFRYMGESHEYLGDTKDAIKNYERALNINPKVGIKRKYTSLLKKQRH